MSEDTEAEWDAAPRGDVIDDPAVINVIIKELAGLDPIEYDRRRQQEAERLNVRVATLDSEVAKLRPNGDNDTAAGFAVVFKEIEPWPEPVDGAGLLDNLVAAVQRFVALPDGAAEAVALWVLHAHCHDAAAISPILALTSPEKRCGKTTALRVMAALAPRPLHTANITVAPLFRSIEKWRPTLFVDEADTFLRDDDMLIGVLNSGHCRETAQLIRSVGEDHEPRAFRTWAPKVVALIGRLPATLEDRSILVQMRRRRPDETVERFRLAQNDAGLLYLARRCARWTADNIVSLGNDQTNIPGGLHDRAGDNWEPLIGIADRAGGRWPEAARRVALSLSAGELDEGSYKTILLGDIRDIFIRHGADRLTSTELCENLAAMEERMWPEWRKGKPITTRQLASMLKGFKVAPSTIRLPAGGTIKGYLLSAFNDPFARYLPILAVTPSQPAENSGKPAIPIRNIEGDVTDRNRPKVAERLACDGVTDENQETPDLWGSDL